MSKHSKIGIKGEQLASDFLLNKGYIIIFLNWRSGKKEVDVIAQKGDMLVFIEVKTRSGTALQYPEEAVNKQKQHCLKSAAAAFSEQYRQYKNIRFDIISVLMENEHVKEIVHFEEAFH
ncbi:MAG: YraN family protein [Taibaiella sp.]|nr:YraN family protein [Taibaiella sp.]